MLSVWTHRCFYIPAFYVNCCVALSYRMFLMIIDYVVWCLLTMLCDDVWPCFWRCLTMILMILDNVFRICWPCFHILFFHIKHMDFDHASYTYCYVLFDGRNYGVFRFYVRCIEFQFGWEEFVVSITCLHSLLRFQGVCTDCLTALFQSTFFNDRHASPTLN
jgi:hypothetical protein